LGPDIDMYILIISRDPLLTLGLSTLIKNNFHDCEIKISCDIENTRPSASFAKPQILLIEQPNLDSLVTDTIQSNGIQPLIAFGMNNNTAIDFYKKYNIDYFIFKNDPIHYIISAIKNISEKIKRESKYLPQQPNTSALPFTQRQEDLAKLLLQGYSNKRIAHALNLSYGTVKNYMSALMQTMSARSRLEIVIKLKERERQTDQFFYNINDSD